MPDDESGDMILAPAGSEPGCPEGPTAGSGRHEARERGHAEPSVAPLPTDEDLDAKAECVSCRKTFYADEMNCPDAGLMCERCYDRRHP